MSNECIPLYADGDVVTAEVTADVKGKTFVDLTGAMAGGLPKSPPPRQQAAHGAWP